MDDGRIYHRLAAKNYFRCGRIFGDHVYKNSSGDEIANTDFSTMTSYV